MLDNNYVTDDEQEDTNNLFLDEDSFFDIFPFYVMLDKDLIITSVGNGLNKVLSGLPERKIDEIFKLIRPTLEFTWNNVSSSLYSYFL